tara:strand:- start:390 stop:809 length:420 start_codon:yes stop_codon:yes gene_type:complete
MALPASGPISGSQIATELDVEAVNISLGGMFASSSLSATDPDAYSEFYGYKSRTVVQRYGSTIAKPSLACNSNYGYTIGVWYVSTTGPIDVGNYCYTTKTGTTVLADGNYAIGSGLNSTPTYVITIANGTGYVSTLLIC